jgi:hypothetical protein
LYTYSFSNRIYLKIQVFLPNGKEIQMAQSQDQLIVGYWGIRGLVEPIRLTLHYTKTPFTDKMYHTGDDWHSDKYQLGLG